ncbi:MAG: NAD-dependent epimerase/dehydratase family protein [Candidatus Taylorbacteria bacterium]|nr:NAD-dependent epimerase/dehydratase family protein [Candidatus Taylorbacteria bacterium]
MAEIKRRVIVTGGLGFIGSYFVDLLLKNGYHVINIDKMTYAARHDLNFDAHPEYELIREDIATLRYLPQNADYLVNFAAESHVDNAITSNGLFFESNIRGVYNLLELIRSKDPNDRPTLIHISTDEVYGEIQEGFSAKENDQLHPENPYSAAKAAAEMLISGWVKTYGLKAKICRSSNNYGHGQYPEKLISKTVNLATKNEKMTVHGDGSYLREWTYAGDNCEGIFLMMEKGLNGEIYNISSGEMFTNLEIVKMVLKAMGKPENLYEFVENRLGQDIRYSVDSSKSRKLGWKPKTSLEKYLPEYLKLLNYKNK